MMVPTTVMLAPGGAAGGATVPGVSPGGGGSGTLPAGNGYAPVDPLETSGANGSGRPRAPSVIAGGLDEGGLGGAWLSVDVEGGFAAAP